MSHSRNSMSNTRYSSECAIASKDHNLFGRLSGGFFFASRALVLSPLVGIGRIRVQYVRRSARQSTVNQPWLLIGWKFRLPCNENRNRSVSITFLSLALAIFFSFSNGGERHRSVWLGLRSLLQPNMDAVIWPCMQHLCHATCTCTIWLICIELCKHATSVWRVRS